ncbi:hypothetical protein [Streptomyces sp. NPDC055099]
MAEEHRTFCTPGNPGTIGCHNCTWTQAIDEDLHEEAVDLLLQWHIVNPTHQVNHLAGPRPGQRLAVPSYVEWFDNQGLLAVQDMRTGRYCLAYNHQCLAVFRSVARDGTLEGAVEDESRRSDVHRAQMRPEIEYLARSQYCKGLLRPAAVTG